MLQTKGKEMTSGYVSDLFSISQLQGEVEQKFVRSQRHPSLPYTIYNYTERAQFEQRWNEVTLNCRGLILDDAGVIIARPFPKFFNHNDANDPYKHDAWGGVRVTDKKDGSLGISYPGRGRPYIATRGSFMSDQAVRANEILRDKYINWRSPSGFTTLFEIIYPENRIVLDYKGEEDLYLLGYVDIKTGLSYSSHTSLDAWTGPRAQQFNFGTLSEALSAPQRSNAEGYVVHYHGSDTRVKIKQQDYLDLHRVVTNLNARRVWQAILDSQPGEDAARTLCEALPDEFHGWVLSVQDDLSSQAVMIESRVWSEYARIVEMLNDWRPGWTRREFADEARQTTIAGWLFLKLDGKDDQLLQSIWQSIKPSSDWTPSCRPSH